MKTLTSVAAYGLVPFPVRCEGHAFPDKDDRHPTTEDANAALLAWHRHLVADDAAVDETSAARLLTVNRRGLPILNLNAHML